MLADPEVLKKYLTSRQLEVVQLLYMGFSRKETAQTLVPEVTHQAVHQIVARIRRRLVTKAGVSVNLQFKTQ